MHYYWYTNIANSLVTPYDSQANHIITYCLLTRTKMKKIHRNKKEYKIAGICSGIGDYFEIDP